MADLVTLAEVKTAFNIDPTDTRQDAIITQAIPGVTQAILGYTERDFGSPLVTEQRTFEYDRSGYLDIDDAVSITDVTIVIPHSTDFALTADQYAPMPARRGDAPVYYYLVMPYYVGPIAPDTTLGFTQNLDVYFADHYYPMLPQMVKVTGQWGWPVIPNDVKQAAFWTIANWTADPDVEENLQAESIESFSRSFGGRYGGPMLAIPNRAKELLAVYQKERI